MKEGLSDLEIREAEMTKDVKRRKIKGNSRKQQQVGAKNKG